MAYEKPTDGPKTRQTLQRKGLTAVEKPAPRYFVGFCSYQKRNTSTYLCYRDRYVNKKCGKKADIAKYDDRLYFIETAIFSRQETLESN